MRGRALGARRSPGAADTDQGIAAQNTTRPAKVQIVDVDGDVLPQTLASRIEAEHQAALGAARTAIEHAIECGKLLIKAKAQIGHGGWLAWVEGNLSFGHRQAQKYTRLAEFSAKVPNAHSNSHLTIDGALAAIAEPSAKPSRPKPKWEPASADADQEKRPAECLDLAGAVRALNVAWSPTAIETATSVLTDQQRADLQQHLPDVLQKLQRLAEPVAPTAYVQPPAGRPRLDRGKLEAIEQAYHWLGRVDQNAFARWVLEHQLGQTDLAPKQKAGLAKVMKVLTSYSEVAS